MKQIMALKPGDTIGIAAPSSPFDRTKFMKGVHALRHLGFKVFYRDDIFDQNRYLAGTDKRRAEEFVSLLRDKDMAAVMFARGGYGSQRIIPLLDPKVIREHAKPVIGCSDLTSLLTFLRQVCNCPTFYGPVITQIGHSKEPVIVESLMRALTAKGPMGLMPMKEAHTIKQGEAKGPIVGGCLALINSSMGTPYELDTEGSILFIEERNEKVYVLDRMLTQLKNSGKIAVARGIIFGAIIPPKEEPYDPETMIRDVLGDFKGPIVTGFPAGHCDEFVTLPLGVDVEIRAPDGQMPSLNCVTGLFV